MRSLELTVLTSEEGMLGIAQGIYAVEDIGRGGRNGRESHYGG